MGIYRVMFRGKQIGQVYWHHHHSNPGWRFAPFYQAQHSRKCWATPEAAIKGRVHKDAVLVTQESEKTIVVASC